MRKILIILILLSAWAVNAQIIYEDSAYVNTSTGWNGVDIRPASPASVIFRNNSITSVNSDGYMLRAGSDLPSEGYVNYLDGAVISGNKLDWNGTPGSDNVHGIILGYSVNYHIRHNYIDRPYLGLVFEGTEGMTYTSGGVSYNIIKKGGGSGIVLNGQNGVNVFNNTFYSSQAKWSPSLIKVSLLTQVSPTATSNNIKIKNNVFYTKNHHAVISFADTVLSTLECDYNVYWAEDNDHTPAFYNETTSTYLTWAQWQALGFDAHSVVVNPNFIDTVNFVPATRLDYGTNLGTSYDDGLSTTASWVVGTAPATVTQDSTWQVGARIYASASAGSDAYYVSTTGSDSNAGTFSAPWLTWQKAFNTAVAGDTVFFRGGTYPSTSTDGFGVYYNPTAGYGHDGTKTNPIVYTNYEAEVPILDCGNNITIDYFYHRGLYIKNVDYVKFKGLTVRNVREQAGVGVEIGFELELCDNVTIEQCIVHNIGGVGFRALTCDTVTFYNCDSHDNCDTIGNVPGNYGTGFNASGANTTGLVTFRGCRSWMNSDQGLSAPAAQKVVIDSCWSFNNSGYLTGDGHGFKLGYNASENPNMTRIVTNCLAFCNKMDGFTTNENESNPWGYYGYLYNNIAYDNARYGFVTYIDEPDGLRVFTNNISYSNNNQETYFTGTANTGVTNSWDVGHPTITDADFLSVDTTGVTGARGANGSLPVLNFLKLAGTSDAIDAGTDVGIAYNGTAPDLGAYEYSEFEEGVVPYLNTNEPVFTWSLGATSGGNMLDAGGGTISRKGICWSTDANPDINDNVVEGGVGTDDFTSKIWALKPNTTYHVRAFATNEYGTGYGADVTFTTPARSFVMKNKKVVKLNGKIVII